MRIRIAALLVLILAVAAPRSAAPQSIVYGSNPAAGHYFEHDGIRLYYEVYGKGAAAGDPRQRSQHLVDEKSDRLLLETLSGHSDGQPRPRKIRGRAWSR